MNNMIESITIKTQMLDAAKRQLSADLACLPEQFDSCGNSIVSPKLIEGRRLFSVKKDFLRMATFGHGAVISADEKVADWCSRHLKNHEGIRILEHDMMYRIENEIRQYGKQLSGICEYYLPILDLDRRKDISSAISIKWYEKDEIPQLYSDTRFKNALLYDVNSLRPDVLAVTAVIDNQIAAMAGASMDSRLFWQIGIDVMPGYRKKGLATYLVSALTDEILNRGAIPYYSTWSANIASRSVAAASGYFPAWVETHAKDL